MENDRNSDAGISATATAVTTAVRASTLAGYVGTYEFNADGKPNVVDVSLWVENEEHGLRRT